MAIVIITWQSQVLFLSQTEFLGAQLFTDEEQKKAGS